MLAACLSSVCRLQSLIPFLVELLIKFAEFRYIATDRRIGSSTGQVLKVIKYEEIQTLGVAIKEHRGGVQPQSSHTTKYFIITAGATGTGR